MKCPVCGRPDLHQVSPTSTTHTYLGEHATWVRAWVHQVPAEITRK